MNAAAEFPGQVFTGKPSVPPITPSGSCPTDFLWKIPLASRVPSVQSNKFLPISQSFSEETYVCKPHWAQHPLGRKCFHPQAWEGIWSHSLEAPLSWHAGSTAPEMTRKSSLHGAYLNTSSYLHWERSPRSTRSDGTRLCHSHKGAGTHELQQHTYLELPNNGARKEKENVSLLLSTDRKPLICNPKYANEKHFGNYPTRSAQPIRSRG